MLIAIAQTLTLVKNYFISVDVPTLKGFVTEVAQPGVLFSAAQTLLNDHRNIIGLQRGEVTPFLLDRHRTFRETCTVVNGEKETHF